MVPPQRVWCEISKRGGMERECQFLAVSHWWNKKTGGVQGERAQINPRAGGYERMPKKHFKSVAGNMTWSLRM